MQNVERDLQTFVTLAFIVCENADKNYTERREALTNLAQQSLRKGINNDESVKLATTEAGDIAVIPSRRQGVIVIQLKDHQALQFDGMEQGFSGSEILNDGTVLMLNTIDGNIYMLPPNSKKLEEYEFNKTFEGMDDGSPITFKIDGQNLTITSPGCEDSGAIPALQNKTIAIPQSPGDYVGRKIKEKWPQPWQEL